MGEQASAATAVEPVEAEETIETPPQDSGGEDPDPIVFGIGGDEEPEPETKAAEPQPEPEAKPSEFDELKKQVADLQAENAKQQKLLNQKFYELRQQKKAEKTETPERPALTEAQLLKILEEHRDEPAVLLQVMKHMTEGQAAKVKDEAIETAEIRQQKQHADTWLSQNFPQVFDETSEMHGQVEQAKNMLRLNGNPLGDYLAVAATMLASYPEMIKQAREDERKKALSEAAEASRKKGVKNAAPAGGKTSKASDGAAGDADLIRQAKDMGLTGDAIKMYVQIRRDAAKQQSRHVMEA